VYQTTIQTSRVIGQRKQNPAFSCFGQPHPQHVQGLRVEKVWPCYAGGSGAQLCEGHIMSTSGTLSAIHGCPVFVLDCIANLHFGRPLKECDVGFDRFVDFLLCPAWQQK